MKRRAVLAAALLPALVRAAQPLRIYAITYRGKTEVERGFADYFASRGIAVEITWRDIALDPAKLPALVDEIRRERPDLVYTWGTGVTLGIAGRWQDAGDVAGAAHHITDIPLVFSLVAAPVDTGIVAQLHAPGRNVTGVSHMAGLSAQVQAMSTYRAFRKVGVLYSPNEPNSLAMLKELNAIGAKQGFAVLAQPFKLGADGRPSGEGAADIVRGLKAEGAEWLYMPPDSFLNTQAKDVVVPAALAAQLPVFASTEQLMASGALLGLVSRYYNIGQFAAYKAEQILVGKIAPGRIPVETLTRFSLQINLPVARRLGVLPPLEMFNYAELIGDASIKRTTPS
ncbi:MAG TPA: ABC transporter substrate-binding protein [Burkholderiaceae bacterium]|jgi:putative ABC transport system substrate-binding protein